MVPVAIAATSVFVGRESELRALHDAFAQASGGHSQVLIVEGEAGIGKTTLVERFLSELTVTRVLRASGHESESHVSFAIADQLLRCDGRGSDALGAGRHVAVGLELLELISADAPCVVVVDDAHLVDAESLRALLFAAAGCSRAVSGVARDEIFVTTKLWMSDYGYDAAQVGFEASLRRLGVDHVDLYLLHQPVPTTSRTRSVPTGAEKMLGDGRAPAIGVSNFSAEHLRELIDRTDVVPAVNQVELHPYFIQPALRELHAELGITTQAWSPLGGVLVYVPGADESRGPLTDPVITELAAKYGKTPAQVVLRWHLEPAST